MQRPRFNRQHIAQPNAWSAADQRVLAAMAQFVIDCESSDAAAARHWTGVLSVLRQRDPATLLREHRLRGRHA
jgi:hypothetical protein